MSVFQNPSCSECEEAIYVHFEYKNDKLLRFYNCFDIENVTDINWILLLI